MAAGVRRKLVLENGSVHVGTGFGAERDALCEMVFNTGMIGYQEMVTDPSCAELMVLMTYPLIGNYGITDEDSESRWPALGALVVREYNDLPSNFRYTKTLGELLEESGIPALQGVDTRSITRMLRREGNMRALLCDEDTPTEEALERIRAFQTPTNLVARVSSPKVWYARTPNPRFQVVAVDCGIKQSAIRALNQNGCNVTVVPFDTGAEKILSFSPDGVFVSSGPGRPQEVQGTIAEIKKLRGKLPLFGEGLGHQILCLACGAKAVPMKVGHHGGNHPVKEVRTGKVEITAQGHSMVIDEDSMQGTGLTVTHLNLLDNTVEGAQAAKDKLFSVQFSAEGAAGPQDSLHLFKRFTQMMEKEGK